MTYPLQVTRGAGQTSLYTLSMLSKKMDDALGTIEALKEKGHPLVYVGDVVGTGSSRKSATNSVLWHMGDDIPTFQTREMADLSWVARSHPFLQYDGGCWRTANRV